MLHCDKTNIVTEGNDASGPETPTKFWNFNKLGGKKAKAPQAFAEGPLTVQLVAEIP